MTASAPTLAYPRTGADQLLTSGVALLLVLQLFNLAVFNRQPEMMKTGIEAVSFLGYCGLFVLAARHAGAATLVHWAGLGLFIGAGLIGYWRHPDQASLLSLAKDITGLMVLSLLTLRQTPAPARPFFHLIWLAAIGATLLGLFQAFTGAPYVQQGIERLGLFVGGEEGLHPSAYAMVIFLFTFLVLVRARAGVWLVSLALMAGALAAIAGYQVRTTWMMLLIFVGYAAALWFWRRSGWLVVMAAGLGCLMLVGLLVYMTSTGFDLASFSSGRTIAYGERLAMVGERGIVDLLFGTGSGSDFMRGVAAWRWEEKDSHNDLMTMLIEVGVVGMIGFAMMVLSVFWAMPKEERGWLLMMAASAVVSNGVLLRPSIGPPLILVAYLAVALRRRATTEAA